METPRGRYQNVGHDWFVAIVTFIAAVASSAILYAYGQGQQEHRIQTLEKEVADIRADWKDARARIEREFREREPPPPEGTMNILITLLILCLVFGIVYYVVQTLIPIPSPMKNIILAIIAVIFVIYLLMLLLGNAPMIRLSMR